MPEAVGSPSPFPLPARLLAGLAILAMGVFAWVAWQRVGYPFELEWMEGAMVDHAARIGQGLPIYAPPGPDHVAFLYTPLFYWLTALLAVGLGDGFLTARLIGLLATVAAVALLGHWVRRECGRVLPGIVAIGLLFLGSGWYRWWLDLARNDSLFVLWMLATGYLLRWHGTRGAFAAAVTAILAFLSKQTAVLWLPAVGVGALLLDWRNGLRFGIAGALGLGATIGIYHLATDGWFTFFVFEMPRGHGIQGDRKLGFWNDDLVPILPAIGLALFVFVQYVRQARARVGLFLAAFASGGLLASYLSRLHIGGFDNVLLYGFVGACLLAPLALTLATSTRGQTFVTTLLLVQWAMLIVDVRALWQARPVLLYDPRHALPTTAHRQAHEEQLAFLQQARGDVFVLSHGHVAAMAGKPRTAHGQAIHDLLNPMIPVLEGKVGAAATPWQQEVILAFHERFSAALRERRFAAIVLDQQVGGAFEGVFTNALQGNYRRRPGPLLTEPAALQPIVGMLTNSPYVLEPVR